MYDLPFIGQPGKIEQAGQPQGESDWIDYPNGLKLANLPHMHKEPCAACGATLGDRHDPGCPLTICPKCSSYLIDCSCRRPLESVILYGAKVELHRRLNALATMFWDVPTSLGIGSDDAKILSQKVAMFENMVCLKKSAWHILTAYPNPQAKTRVDPPRIIQQAYQMQRQANKIWLDWFWK